MDELVRWLGEQLDEDERIARAAAAVRGPVWWYEGYLADLDGQVLAGEVLDGGGSAVRSLAMTTQSDAEGEHAARHDPARVLREIDAKRRVITGLHHLFRGDDPFVSSIADDSLRSLAEPYADRPGYRAEWRP